MVKIDDNLKRSVLLYLCNHDKAPNKNIEKALGVKGAYITRALRSLGPIIITSPSDDNTKPRSLVCDIHTLQKLVQMFDLEAQNHLLQSQYYRRMIPKIIEDFESAIPWVYPNTTPGRSDPRWRNYAPNGEGSAVITLTAFEKESMKQSLHRSPLALDFALKFIRCDEDERINLYARVECGLKHLKIDKSEITDIHAVAQLQDHEYIELPDEDGEGKSTFADVFDLLTYVDDFVSDLR